LTYSRGILVKGEYLFYEEARQNKNVRASFITALKRAGIKDFRFHELRNTSCSYMTMRGAAPQAVQNHAGHSSMKMTERYSHFSPAYERDSIQFLNGLCGRILKTSEDFSEKTVKQEEVKQHASA
jgi:integrase